MVYYYYSTATTTNSTLLLLLLLGGALAMSIPKNANRGESRVEVGSFEMNGKRYLISELPNRTNDAVVPAFPSSDKKKFVLSDILSRYFYYYYCYYYNFYYIYYYYYNYYSTRSFFVNECGGDVVSSDKRLEAAEATLNRIELSHMKVE